MLSYFANCLTINSDSSKPDSIIHGFSFSRLSWVSSELFSSPCFLNLNSIYKSILSSLIALLHKSLGFNRIAKKKIITDYQTFTIILWHFLFYFFSFLPSLNSYLRYVLPPLVVNSFPTILYTVFRKSVSSTSGSLPAISDIKL